MTDAENRAAVLMKARDLRIIPVPKPPAPAPGQVTVRIINVGICGSDCHYLSEGAIGAFVVRAPMIIGHECAGVVIALGEGVESLAIGDRVALEPGLPCRRCAMCRAGEYNLCAAMRFFATPPVDGALVLQLNHDADFCHQLPAVLTFEQGALCEPLSVGVYACERGGVRPGFSVAVFGAGPIGLVTMLAARAFGASHVVVTDVSEDRLAFATKLGADAVINVAGRVEADIIADLLAGNQAEPFSVSIDCCGFESAIRTAIRVTQSGGVVVLVGMGDNEVRLPLVDAACRQVDLRGVFRYRNTYPTCIRLLSQGQIDVRPLISHRNDWSRRRHQGPFSSAIKSLYTDRTRQSGSSKYLVEAELNRAVVTWRLWLNRVRRSRPQSFMKHFIK